MSRPSRPPPPTLPAGWVARWDETYQRYYYANTLSGDSQWEVPDAPATKGPAPPAAPPSYLSNAEAQQTQQYIQPVQAQAQPVQQAQPQVQYVQASQPQVQYQQAPPQQIIIQQSPQPTGHHQDVHVVETRQSSGVGRGIVTGMVVGSVLGRRRLPPRRRW